MTLALRMTCLALLAASPVLAADPSAQACGGSLALAVQKVESVQNNGTFLLDDGRTAKLEGIRLSNNGIEFLQRNLAGRTPALLAVTDGANGSWWHDGKAVHHIAAHPVKAIDTLGAGDVFHGACVLALAEGRNFEQALRFSAAAAAIKCTRFGGVAGAPARAEVDAFLASGRLD